MEFLVIGATTCFVLAGVIVFLGIAILRDAVKERLHRVTALMLFFGGLGAFLAGLGLAARASAPQGATAFTEMAVSFASAWEFFFPSLLLFTLVFPTESPWLKRFPWLQELTFVPYLFHLVLTVLADASNGNFFLPELAKQAGWLSAFLAPLRVGLSLVYNVHAVLFSFVNLGYIALTRPGGPLAALDPRVTDPTILLVIAYAVRRLPYVVGSASAGLEQTSPALEEAAQNLGAGIARTVTRVKASSEVLKSPSSKETEPLLYHASASFQSMASARS